MLAKSSCCSHKVDGQYNCDLLHKPVMERLNFFLLCREAVQLIELVHAALHYILGNPFTRATEHIGRKIE